jgi:pimeloyl-ACP methyl ester carboxylesterase
MTLHRIDAASYPTVTSPRLPHAAAAGIIRDPMRPFFFGRDRRLYGALHEARGAARGVGVLLCYPGVQEYNVTHWAFRRLASLLVRAGFHVLRFDYSCTGDSEGETHDGRVDHWLEDIATAADELKDAAGVRKISLLGLRLGALLAARAVSAGLEVKDLVLWEPVFTGAGYVAELERLDEELLTRKMQRIVWPRVELAGHPFPSSLRAALLGSSLEPLVPRAASRISFFLTHHGSAADATCGAWQRAGLDPKVHVVEERRGGVSGAAGDSAVLYEAMLEAIALELGRGRSLVAA